MWSGWNIIQQAVTSAAQAAGTPGGSSAISSVIVMLNANHQYATVAAGALTQLQVGFATTPPSPSVMFTLQSLEQMIINNQLPQSIQPYVEELMNPSVQSNPVAVADAIANIKAKLGE